jgi:hypothetical protein
VEASKGKSQREFGGVTRDAPCTNGASSKSNRALGSQQLSAEDDDIRTAADQAGSGSIFEIRHELDIGLVDAAPPRLE